MIGGTVAGVLSGCHRCFADSKSAAEDVLDLVGLRQMSRQDLSRSTSTPIGRSHR